ncbi:hypothetical protein AAFF_G00088740 [Aldrovandia affinis]|uniref:TIR domain-containing protein n=1 Tax=Aldrovandia affinis TaxID=143900 RepID=A0AAD7RWI4_9TELE|nr:hypothetical protein AAFF_G00088740 [Aldrovandia affinis]
MFCAKDRDMWEFVNTELEEDIAQLSSTAMHQIRMRRACGLIVLGVYLLVEKISLCRIRGELALCDSQSLFQVPKLPSYVTRVSLTNNYISEVNETSFAGQEQLETVYLGSQRTNTFVVRSNAFRGLSNLTYLDLGDMRGLVLEPGAFVGLTSLRNLALFHSGLDDSILQGEYLRPLESLETLDLYGNRIGRIRPALFFQNMTKLQEINLTLNAVGSICEGDLLGFRGKHFDLLKLSSVRLRDMTPDGINWTKCGNPFRNMSIRVLDLSGNGFGAENTRLFFKGTEGTSIHSLILSSNPMGRSIGLKEFLIWVNETNATLPSPKESLRCEFPENLLGVRLVDLNTDSCEEEDDEKLIAPLKLALFVASSTVLVLTVASGLAYARLRAPCFLFYKRALAWLVEGRRPKGTPRDGDAPVQEGLRYDAYLCFSNADFRWVERALLKRLDSQFSDRNLLRFCFEARDFVPGEDHVANIRDAIWRSRKTVCVISREFLNDGWCLEAFSLAQSRMLEELRDVLVVVVVGAIPHFRLMKYQPIRAFVQKREYLQWPEDSQDMEWFYNRLVLKILKEDKVRKQRDVELQNIN